jgi:hypothetical protein
VFHDPEKSRVWLAWIGLNVIIRWLLWFYWYLQNPGQYGPLSRRRTLKKVHSLERKCGALSHAFAIQEPVLRTAKRLSSAKVEKWPDLVVKLRREGSKKIEIPALTRTKEGYCKLCDVKREELQCRDYCKHEGEKHTHYRCPRCGSRTLGLHIKWTKPTRARRQFLYELASGPKTGKEIQKALLLKWVQPKGDRRRRHNKHLFRLSRKYHIRKQMLIKHLTWLMEKGYVEWETRLVPKKMLWRTLLYKKRCYKLTEKGEKYIWKWIEECGF